MNNESWVEVSLEYNFLRQSDKLHDSMWNKNMEKNKQGQLELAIF